MNSKNHDTLNVIDVFSPAFERWETRERTQEEHIAHLTQHGYFGGPIKTKLLKTITSTYQAAEHMAEHLTDNCLENFIDNALSKSSAMEQLRSLMPTSTPPALKDYKSNYPTYSANDVASEIEQYGVFLANDQTLIHGGCWPTEHDEFITDRPFSTTFCPQIARRSAEWKGKAYDAGRMDLIVLRVVSPFTKAYLYGTDVDHSHEKEILFAKGARLILISRTHICDTYVFKVDTDFKEYKKQVPAYVVEAEIS
ncbi:hypothetical protein [Pseudomonas salomonii]|uniref:ADP ribosyltransferase domain-containing protein n=1 Tax=Pseudomonas salomonii TaxID=191391 RepID=A0A1H3JG90_9PSED|nr:hypothetical protein [Pseudomonas salomonii]SDY38224.1 hypothetical protein SAMN05216247_103556 [Pseudomonas salomonii]